MRSKQKKMVKPLILLILIVIFCVSLLVNINAGSFKYETGSVGVGPFGWTCYCDIVMVYNCCCALPK